MKKQASPGGLGIMFFVFIFFITSSSNLVVAQNCPPARCHPHGPIVRFPFRLISHHPPSCGFPSFDLHCDSNNRTLFNFQYPVSAVARNFIIPVNATATVDSINYQYLEIQLALINWSCIPARPPNTNVSASPFDSLSSSGYTLFNCSDPIPASTNEPIQCLSRGSFRVYPINSYSSLSDVSSLSRCVKMYDISDVPDVGLGRRQSMSIGLSWTVPDCRACESKNHYCRLKNNSNETECQPKPPNPAATKKERLKKIVTAVVVVGSFLVTLVVGALGSVYHAKKKKRDNQKKLVRFMDDYRALRATRYSYSDIRRMTEGFKHKLGRGGYGTVFKGMLSSEIPVAVKILNNIKGPGDDFINEVRTIGNIHHVNVVRLVGYCADGYRRALVYEYLENDSLEKYIVWGNQKSKLAWPKLFEIVLGIAKGLEYLHQGCNQRILHFDIKPHNILLDQNLNPKVADFGLAKLCSKDKSVITMTAARGTIGYIAPEVFSRNFGRVSYKSDIYSFGMVLLNLVAGKKNVPGNVLHDESQVYFPEWMYNQMEKGDDIAFDLDSVEDVSIVKRLITIGLWCIQWYPIDRPSMKLVIQMMETEGMPIVPPNPFAATNSGDENTDSWESWDSSGAYSIAKN